METTERIVEAYCRYIKDLFTISNIPCKSHEIDIVAVKLSNKHFQKYHIEVSISNTRPYAKLIHKDTPPNHKAKEKRTIEYFIAKFNNPDTINKLDSIGFKTNKYKKVIVTNGWDKSVEEIAKKNNIELWNFIILP